MSNRPSTSSFSSDHSGRNSDQSQTLTQTISRVNMTCTTPPDQRSHNLGHSHNPGPSHLQPGPSGRVGNGRMANFMNTLSQQDSNIETLSRMSGPIHHGSGLSGQNINQYNQNAFSQQCPPLVNYLSMHSDGLNWV